MLGEFIAANRDDIISRARDRVCRRQWPPVAVGELEHGVPLFLTQLTQTLRLEASSSLFPGSTIGDSAARHGGELKRLGLTVSQVVHGYGDICQAITAIAVEQHAPITVEEFHTLNRCLDTAIAEAVTEHGRVTAQTQSAEEVERLGQMAHELRDALNTATLAFQVLRRGTVAINGSTGEVLGRSLMTLREIVDRALAEVRLATGTPRRERIVVAEFIDDIAAAAMLHAEYRHVQFRVDPVDAGLRVNADAQLLASAVMNLLHNAFKNTPVGGRVVLRTRAEGARLLVEVEDECGGLSQSPGGRVPGFGDRRASDRSGLGLGLSIARQAVREHEGEIRTRNLVGQGCIFIIEVPLAAEDVCDPAR
jgi:signal transduction histidine kinase